MLKERSGKNDQIHIVVVDDTGKVSGTAGSILEKYTFLSKASTQKLAQHREFTIRIIWQQTRKYFCWCCKPLVQAYFLVLEVHLLYHWFMGFCGTENII